MTMTMTMTHSDEVTNGSQIHGPADVSAGVMTPRKKNRLSLYALLSKQGGLLVLCIKTVHRVASRAKKKQNQQAHTKTSSSEFKEVNLEQDC